jgi:hypothetical protein
MKYFYYVSRSKVEMLAPQLRRPKFSFKLSPKVAVAGVSIGADIERRDDSALIKQLDEVLQGLEKKKLVREIHDGIALDDGSFVHSNSIWRHGLFYFKGGVPGFGTSIHEQERTFITSVIYVAWTTFGRARRPDRGFSNGARESAGAIIPQ